MGRERGTYVRQEKCMQVLIQRPEGKRTLRRPRSKWGIIFKWIFKKLNGVIDWIDLAKDVDM